MRNTPAVRSAKAGQGNRCSPRIGKDVSPDMFSTDGVVGVPDLFELGCLAQVVNMPVGTLRNLCMVSNAGQHPARPKCAPDVDIKSRQNG